MVTMHISKPIWEGTGYKQAVNPMGNHPYTIDQFFPADPADLKQMLAEHSQISQDLSQIYVVKHSPPTEGWPQDGVVLRQSGRWN